MLRAGCLSNKKRLGSLSGRLQAEALHGTTSAMFCPEEHAIYLQVPTTHAPWLLQLVAKSMDEVSTPLEDWRFMKQHARMPGYLRVLADSLVWCGKFAPSISALGHKIRFMSIESSIRMVRSPPPTGSTC